MELYKNINPRGSGLVIIVTVILILNLVLTNTIIYVTMKKNLKQNLIEDEIPARSAWLRSQIEQEIQAPLIISTVMAEDLFVKRWMSEGEKESAFIIKYLESVRSQQEATTCFLVSEKTRTYYNMNGAFPVLENDPDARWYFNFMNSAGEWSINITANVDMNNIPTVFINKKIREDNGQTLGVAGIGIEFAVIPAILTEYSRDFNRDIYFIDSEGTFIGRSDGALFYGRSIQDHNALKNLEKTILAPDNSILEINFEGESLIASSMYIEKIDWWLLSVQKESEALRKMNVLILLVIIIHIIAILLTLLFIFISVRFFQSRLKKMATTDVLTGINNRQLFEYSLRQTLAAFSRTHSPVSLLIMDLDFFKKINDSQGHLEGDKVLIKTAQIIRNLIRRSDEFSRWGGEEFVILAYDCSLPEARELGEKIRKTLEENCVSRYPNGDVLTISIGITEVKEDDTEDSLLHRADSALYSAKAAGRNCIKSI